MTTADTPSGNGGAPTASNRNALPPGTIIGDFEVTGVVGEGGFGIVYRAHDRVMHRHVALKEYLPNALARRRSGQKIELRASQYESTFKAGLKSFLNEARLLAQFDHPALVKVLHFWEENQTAYMVMPLYEGRTLKAHLRDSGRPDEKWLKAFLVPLLDAIETLHSARCFHRDIAPDNILMLNSGNPLLLDFGAARRIIGDMAQAVTVVIKPGYAPVEQYADDPAFHQGPWTDIYALAAVVHLAITGKAPATSVTRMVTDPVRPLVEIASGYSDEFLRAIDHALAVRPEDRPQSVAEFREELKLPMAPTRQVGPLPPSERTAAVASETKPLASRPAIPARAAAIPPPSSNAVAPERALTTSSIAPSQSAAAAPPSQKEPRQDLILPPPPSAPAPPAAVSTPEQTLQPAILRDPLGLQPWSTSQPAAGATPISARTPSGIVISGATHSAPAPIGAPASVASTGPSAPTASPSVPSPRLSSADPLPVPDVEPSSGRSQVDNVAPMPTSTPFPQPPAYRVPWRPIAIVVGLMIGVIAVWYAAMQAFMAEPASTTASAPGTTKMAPPTPAPASPPSEPATPGQASPAPPKIMPAEPPPVVTPSLPPPAIPAGVPRAAPPTAPAPPDIVPPAAMPASPPQISASVGTAPPAASTGRVVLDVRPWGEIFVDGKRLGMSPPQKSLMLPEGPHRIEVRNPVGAPAVFQVTVKAGGRVAIAHTFK